jgi:DNA-binding winged helix-turn-helix (wHTH) protein
MDAATSSGRGESGPGNGFCRMPQGRFRDGLFYRFEPFTVDANGRALLCHDVTVPLRPKTFALLEVLVRAAGRLVTRDELYESLWPDDIVSEQNLAQQVFLLRTTLSSHAPGRAYVATEPGRGYRFVAPVKIDSTTPLFKTDVERLTLRGRFFWEKRTPDGFAKAQDFFERALAADPGHAPAYAGLADVELLRAEYLFERPAPAFERAREAALHSLALDPSAPQPAAALGDIAFYHDRDFGESERWFASALAAHPRYVTARAYRAWCRLALGQIDDARADVEEALRDAPYDLALHTTIAVCEAFSGRPARVLEHTEFVLDLEPAYHTALYYRAIALALSGRDADGLDVLRAHEGTRTSQAGLGIAAFCAVRCGAHDIAQAAEERLAEYAREGFVSAFNAALPAVARGDAATAARIVARGVSERDPWCVFVLHHPLFEGVRATAQFRTVMDLVRTPVVVGRRTG